MALFKKEEALILGYMLSKYFTTPRSVGFSGSYGNFDRSWGWSSEGENEDGSGGYPRGKNGKPPYATANGDLCGSGGFQTEGGFGIKKGVFGYGGNGAGYTSAGGGGGFFGGGSGYVYAGGGGGSSFVYDDLYFIQGYMDLEDYFREKGKTFNKEDYLGSLAHFEYNANMGNGYVTVGNRRFDYTGTVQKYEIPEDGVYLIECYGAQGGSFSVSDDFTKPLVGGFGGYSSAKFTLKQGDELFIYVGQYGGNIKAPLRPFGGGGGSAGTCKAGGGASDVRLRENDLYSRLIVAGGGGGAGGGITDDGEIILVDENLPTQLKDTELTTGKQMFIISDLSIAYVDLTYKCSFDGVEDKKIKVSLYVDGVKRGVQELSVISGGGFQTFTFDNFDDWLPHNTRPYWATLEAIIETDLPQITVPKNGCILRVETKTRANDGKAILEHIFGYFNYKLYSSSYIYTCIGKGGGGGGDDLEELKHIETLYNAQSFSEVFIRIIKRLCSNAYSQAIVNSFCELLFEEKEKPSLTDLTYITSSSNVGSYTAFFINAKEHSDNFDTMSEVEARSYMKIDIKTTPSLQINTISTASNAGIVEIKVNKV